MAKNDCKIINDEDKRCIGLANVSKLKARVNEYSWPTSNGGQTLKHSSGDEIKQS